MNEAEKLREQAKRLRQSAQYADGRAYWDEIEAAAKLEYQAQLLENSGNCLKLSEVEK